MFKRRKNTQVQMKNQKKKKKKLASKKKIVYSFAKYPTDVNSLMKTISKKKQNITIVR
jgi:ATP-dependent protease HslVU (ClpYQ) peptidase subunit